MSQLKAALDPSRRVLSVAGADAESFLQGLLTNDVARAGADRAIYAALLSPQGKFLFDMLVLRPSPEVFWMDVAADQAAALSARLGLYKLRAAVTIEERRDLSVALFWGAGSAPDPVGEGVLFADPRDPALGWRWIAPAPEPALAAAEPADLAAHEALRIRLGVPKSGAELISGETFPLEADFERVHGVDFKKGCYVGQEVTARMRHKAVLKKGLRRLRVEGEAPAPGAEIRSDGKPAGVLGASADGIALAILRLDRISDEPLEAGPARLSVIQADD